MNKPPISAFGPEQTLACHPRPFALRYRRACLGRTRNIRNSSVFSVPLCPLCQTQPPSSTHRCQAARAPEVFFEHRGHRGTEDTEKAIGQLGGPRRPFDTSGRTGVGGTGVSAQGRKPAFTPTLSRK